MSAATAVLPRINQSLLQRRPHPAARIQAVTGKTWNHPALGHGRLFARHAEEIACYGAAEQEGVTVPQL